MKAFIKLKTAFLAMLTLLFAPAVFAAPCDNWSGTNPVYYLDGSVCRVYACPGDHSVGTTDMSYCTGSSSGGGSSSTACTAGRTEYRASDPCGTDSRTCCKDGTWSDWNKDCCLESEGKYLNNGVCQCKRLDGTKPDGSCCPSYSKYDASAGKCYKGIKSVYGNWATLTTTLEGLYGAIGGLLCDPAENFTCGDQETERCYTYREKTSSGGVMDWREMGEVTGSMPDSCDGNKSSKYTTTSCKECTDVYYVQTAGYYNTTHFTTTDTSCEAHIKANGGESYFMPGRFTRTSLYQNSKPVEEMCKALGHGNYVDVSSKGTSSGLECGLYTLYCTGSEGGSDSKYYYRTGKCYSYEYTSVQCVKEYY